MNCYSCKKPGVKENEFCPHCGALVPRRSADVADYADFQLDGDSKAVKNNINKNEFYGTPAQKWGDIWRDIQKEFDKHVAETRGSGTQEQNYGLPNGKTQSRPTYNTATEPKYRQATALPTPRKTTTKKPSFLPGLIIFAVIFAVTVIVPNILGSIDFDEYEDNFFEVSVEADGNYFYDYTLTSFNIENIVIKDEKVIAFDILFEYPTPFAKGSEYSSTPPLKGEIEVLGKENYPATIDEDGIHIKKCDFEVDGEIIFLSASFYDEEDGFGYNYYFSKPYDKGIMIIFSKDGSYAIG